MAFQAKLTTKLPEYSVDDAIIELKNTVTRAELNKVIISLLKQLDKDDLAVFDNIIFDFIIGGRLLRTSIADHFELYADELNADEILNEKLVEVEFTIPSESPKPLDTIQQNDWISCVDTNDDLLITGSYDNSICIYSLKDRQLLLSMSDGHKQPISDIKFMNYQNLPDKNNKKKIKKSINLVHFVSSSYDETCRLWEYDPSKREANELVTFRGHKRSVDCLDIQQDLLVTGSFDKTIKIWSSLAEPDDSEKARQTEEEENSSKMNRQKRRRVKATNQVSSSDSQQLSETTTKSPTIKRDPTITLTGHKDGVRGVKWTNRGTSGDSLASCSLDGLIILWDIESGSETRKFVSAKPMLGLDYSESKNLLLTAACDRFVRLWDMRAPDESRASAVYSSHSGWVSSVSFCNQQQSDGGNKENNFVSGGYDNLVKLWDLRSSKACLYDLIGHHDRVFDVNCNNPSFVVSGSADSTVRLYATKAKKQAKAAKAATK